MHTINNDGNVPQAKGHAIKVEVLPPETCSALYDTAMLRDATENLLNAVLDKIENTSPAKLKKVKTITFRQNFRIVPTHTELSVDLED